MRAPCTKYRAKVVLYFEIRKSLPYFLENNAISCKNSVYFVAIS